MTEQYSNTQFGNSTLMLRALKSSPYTTMGALAELIDNSIDAGATNIKLIAMDKVDRSPAGKQVQRLDKLAVLDDGCGMDPKTIQDCLSIGFTSGRGSNKDIGKFGYGMSVGSLTQTWKFEVYSWQDSGPIHHTYIDFDEMEKRNDNAIPTIVEIKAKDLPVIGPLQMMKTKGYQVGESGTLVVWSQLDDDKVKVKTSDGIIRRFFSDLSRIYRHFLDDDDTYGVKRNIEVVHLSSDNREMESRPLLANDPTYLLTPNTLPMDGTDYSTMSTNEIEDEEILEIKYTDKVDGKEKTSKVKVIFTLAKPEIRALGGGSPVGKHYQRNNGISFVRAGREIELNDFGFVDRYTTTERWWGCEVQFEPCLDDLFGVANDKQHINNIKGYDDSNHAPILGEDFADESVTMNIDLDKSIKNHVAKMRNYLRATAITRGPRNQGQNTVAAVNAEIKKSGDTGVKTYSKKKSEGMTREEKLNEHITVLVDKDPKLSEKEAKQQAEEKVDWEIDIITRQWPGYTFLATEVVGQGIQAQINVDTQFYKVFFSHLEDKSEQDPKSLEAMKIVMMAFARAEDELTPSRDPNREIFAELKDRWGFYVNKLIDISAN